MGDHLSEKITNNKLQKTNNIQIKKLQFSKYLNFRNTAGFTKTWTCKVKIINSFNSITRIYLLYSPKVASGFFYTSLQVLIDFIWINAEGIQVKKFSVLMLLIISGVQGPGISAQETPSTLVIISAGLSRTEITYDNPHYSPASDMGFSASVLIQPSQNSIINVRFGLKYSMLRFKKENQIVSSFFDGNDYVDIKASHHQVSFPFLLLLTPLKIPVIFNAGVEAGIPFSGHVEINYHKDEGVPILEFEEGKSEYNYTTYIRDINFAYSLGVGYKLSLFGKDLEFSVSYYANFNSLYQDDENLNYDQIPFPLDTFVRENSFQNELIFSVGIMLN